MSEAAPLPGSDDVDDSADFEIGDIEAQASSQDVGSDDLEALQDQVNDLEERIEIVGQEHDEEFPAFIAQVNTDNSWGEVVPVNGVLSLAGNATASDWRHFTNDTSSGAGLIQLAAGQSLVLQAQDGTTMQFIQISPTAGSKTLGKILSVSGSFPQWNYTLEWVLYFDPTLTGPARWVTDTTNSFTAVAALEWPGTPPYTYGNGVTITSASGQVDGSACLILPIPGGTVVPIDVTVNIGGTSSTYSFTIPNADQQ